MSARASLKKPTFERLEARISAEKKTLFKHAAELTGRSLTDFIISAADEAASRIIQEQHQIVLSLRDHQAFLKALEKPSIPSANLIKAMKKYKKEVISK